MATRTIVQKSCDFCEIDDGETDTTVAEVTTNRMSLNGIYYDMEMCGPCLSGEGLRLAQAGRPVTAKPKRNQRPRNAYDRHRARAIRAWGIEQGMLPADSIGRLPLNVIESYDSATS